MLFLVIQESCIKKPFSDVEQKTEVIFIFRASQYKRVSCQKKSEDIILELNCDAPLLGLIENVHVCKSNKLI